LTVQLALTSGGDIEETYSLQRVDGNLEGYVREEGIFADAPNYLYKVRQENINLIGGRSYRLIINRGDDLPAITGDTRVVSDLILRSPNIDNSPNIAIEYDRPLSFRWEFNKTDAVFFDVLLHFNYKEASQTTPATFVDKSLQWVVEKNIPVRTNNGISSDQLSYNDRDGIEFYRYLAANLDNGRQKIFQSISIEILGGGQELFDYINIGQVNTGITSSQEIPSFTNMSEGLGVFSSRNSVFVEGFALTAMALDSLQNGIFTKDLNFN